MWKLIDSFHIWEVGANTAVSRQHHSIKCLSSWHACHLRSSQLAVHPPNHCTFNFADRVRDLPTAGFNPEQGGQGTCSHAFLPLGLLLLPHILPRAEGMDFFFRPRGIPNASQAPPKEGSIFPALVTECVIANEQQGEKQCC